jgi:type VI secretion system protein ImpA
MALSRPIDVERFRQPLSAGAPCGVDVRTVAPEQWSRLTDARADASRAERAAENGVVPENAEVKAENVVFADWSSTVPKWEPVRDEALAILETSSYDLLVVQYLVEALVRLDGFAGLAAGFDVARELVTCHWANLFPLPDPDDGQVDAERARALPLERLTDRLLDRALRQVPLTASGYSLLHYTIAEQFRGVSGDKFEEIRQTKRWALQPAAFETSLNNTSPERIRDWYGAAGRAAEALESLRAAVAQASQDRVKLEPGKVQDILEACRAVAKRHAAEIVDDAVPPPVGAPGGAAAGTADAVPAGDMTMDSREEAHPLAQGGGGRENAIGLLERAAEIFDRSDPHSLIGAHIRYTVTLARMSREDFYSQLISDQAVLDTLSSQFGLSFKKPAGSSNGSAP